MKSFSKLYSLLLVMITAFFSCSPETPTATFAWESKSHGMMGEAWCCRVPGTTCTAIGQGWIQGIGANKGYIDSKGIKSFILNKDWQSQLGEDVSSDVINAIVELNPKSKFLNDNLLVVFKDSTADVTDLRNDNVLMAFRYADSPDCDEVLGN